MAMPSTLLCAGLLLLLPVSFVYTTADFDPDQPYKVNNDVDNDESYVSFFYRAPARFLADKFRSFSESSVTRDVEPRSSAQNFLSLGGDSVNEEDGLSDGLYVNSRRQNDDLRQAIGAALADDNPLPSRIQSAMDTEQEKEEEHEDEDEEVEDNQQTTGDNNNNNNNNNGYDSTVGRFALMQQDKRSSLGKRLQFLNQDMREHYMRMFNPHQGRGVSGAGVGGGSMRELKRERHGGVSGGGGGGPTLSVESPMDLIRQRLMQELRRRELVQKQRQIQTNDELLSSIGKRNGRRQADVSPPPPPSFKSRLPSFAN